MEAFIIEIWWEILAVIVFGVTGTLIAAGRKRRAMMFGGTDRPTQNHNISRAPEI